MLQKAGPTITVKRIKIEAWMAGKVKLFLLFSFIKLGGSQKSGDLSIGPLLGAFLKKLVPVLITLGTTGLSYSDLATQWESLLNHIDVEPHWCWTTQSHWWSLTTSKCTYGCELDVWVTSPVGRVVTHLSPLPPNKPSNGSLVYKKQTSKVSFLAISTSGKAATSYLLC